MIGSLTTGQFWALIAIFSPIILGMLAVLGWAIFSPSDPTPASAEDL